MKSSVIERLSAAFRAAFRAARARLFPPSMLVVLSALIVLPAACQRSSKCDKICGRVARCRAQEIVGKPILGERVPQPDARCLKRCAKRSEEFDSCEGKVTSCSALRDCAGSFR